MKSFTFLIALAFPLAAVHVAHADYLFTWEGNSNLFQGSFEVTDSEMLQTNQFWFLDDLSGKLAEVR
jgi:hypothetical protein